jgi:hypothetical protein
LKKIISRKLDQVIGMNPQITYNFV